MPACKSKPVYLGMAKVSKSDNEKSTELEILSAEPLTDKSYRNIFATDYVIVFRQKK